MCEKDRLIAEQFKKKLIENQIPVREMFLFGSRVRGDSDQDSDLDVLVLLDWKTSEMDRRISHYAWEVGFEADVIVQPVVMTYKQAKEGPEKSSLLLMAVEEEGVSV
ncbi:MAG: nucleotidyltransferase domain-containing protein [Candidatus Omnitrophota bacterium]